MVFSDKKNRIWYENLVGQLSVLKLIRMTKKVN